MATLTIRNIDDDVVERLKQRAKANNRSLEAELRQIATEAAEASADRKMSTTELIKAARRIREMTRDVPQTDSAELIRADRDR